MIFERLLIWVVGLTASHHEALSDTVMTPIFMGVSLASVLSVPGIGSFVHVLPPVGTIPEGAAEVKVR